MENNNSPFIEITDLVKKFGTFTALNGVSLNVLPGEVHALLGDNGAGKSTLIKVLSGVHQPTSGIIKVGGSEVKFSSPREATSAGIGTVYQDLALNALTSVTRNFFLGNELKKGPGPFGILDFKKMDEITITDSTYVAELKDNSISEYQISPKDFGLNAGKLSEISAQSPEDSLQLIREAFSGDKSAVQDMIALNAGAALYLAKVVNSIVDGVELSFELMNNGMAADKLASYVRLSNS